jgi:protein-S-isoprenylcysteine O-methyltransferase Ste14
MNMFILSFGISCYLLFFYTILAFIFFVGNLGTYLPFLNDFFPYQIDSSVGAFSIKGLFINILLIALFAIQHSTMARQWFKKYLIKWLPESIERSVYVFSSSMILLILMIFWQPMTSSLWQIENTIGQTIIWIVFALGWSLLFLSSFIINHFDLFGLRQTYLAFIQKEYTNLPFQIKSLYKTVRHPLYLGFILGLWATPVMTIGHLILALGFTSYIFIGIYFEERDMYQNFGEKYRTYQESTAKIIPFWPRKK